MSLTADEIQHRNDSELEVTKNAEPTYFTFDAKRTFKKPRASIQEKPHARMHGGSSKQEEVCTHPMTDGGQTNSLWNMANESFDGHRDTKDMDQTDGCKYSVFGR